MAEKYQCPSCLMRESRGSLIHVKESWRIGPLLASCLPCPLFLNQESSALAGEPALAYGPSCQTRGLRPPSRYPLAFRPFAPSPLGNPALLTRTTLRFPAPAGFRFGVSRCCMTDIASFLALCQNPWSEHVSRFPKNPLQRSDLHKRQTAPTPALSIKVTLLPTRYLTLSPDL